MVRPVADEEDILVQYLRRSYHAVDGLWFLQVEGAHGFEEALEMDRRVWEGLAKIQARKARELVGKGGNGVDALARCFSLKLTADGHRFDLATDAAEIRFIITGCPWLELLRKSGRESLASQIALAICATEGQVWCAEFGGEYEFAMPAMMCAGDEHCEMRFTHKDRDAGVR